MQSECFPLQDSTRILVPVDTLYVRASVLVCAHVSEQKSVL